MNAGDIVLVKFPFSDLESSKKRPALLLVQTNLTLKVGVVSIAMITSKVDGLKFPGDHRIEEWQEAGLLHPSLIRLAKIATIDKEMVYKSLGRLNARDLRSVKSSFQKHFKTWLH
jgi:mRNA interferase MazF